MGGRGGSGMERGQDQQSRPLLYPNPPTPGLPGILPDFPDLAGMDQRRPIGVAGALLGGKGKYIPFQRRPLDSPKLH